jgi:hypothetical protein
MPIRNHTGIIPRRLNGSGGGQTQTWAAGQQLSWLLKGLPGVAGGNLCNYLLGILVTVTGRILVEDPGSENVNAPGSADPRLLWRTQWDIIRSLFESVEVNGAWHGTPLSSQHVKGSFLQLIETVGNGMQRPFRQKPPIGVPAEPGPTARRFRYNVFIPLSLLAGEKGHHTALPAVLYEGSEFKLQCSSAATGPWGSDTITQVHVDASALLLPEAEVRLGPCVQWIDYQQKVAGEAVDINNLGLVSTCDNVQKGAGIAGLFWASNRNGLPGPGQVRDITDLTIPFRDIIHTKHTDPVVLQFENIMGGPANPGGMFVGDDGDGSDEASGDVAGFPYDDFDYGVSELGANNDAALLPPNPLFLAVVCPSQDLELTKIATYEGTQQCQYQHRAGTPAVDQGTHHHIAVQIHSWTPAAFASAKQRLIESGVCKAVLGTNDVDWGMKLKNKQDPRGVSDKKMRYLPMRLTPVVGAEPQVK